MVPAAGEAFGLDANLLLFFGLEQVQGDAAEAREVLGRVALADAAVVFAEVDVQAPVEGVLDAPMPANQFQQSRCVVSRQAADVVAIFVRGLSVYRPLGLDADRAIRQNSAAGLAGL